MSSPAKPTGSPTKPTEESKSSGSMYAQTDIKNGEEVIKAGESVSKSDLGDDYDQLVEEGVVSDSKPNPTNDPVVGAMLPVDEREGDRMLKDEDTKDATSIGQVFKAAAEKS